MARKMVFAESRIDAEKMTAIHSAPSPMWNMDYLCLEAIRYISGVILTADKNQAAEWPFPKDNHLERN